MENIIGDEYLGIIKAEMMVECLKTIDIAFIKEIVLRAGGKVVDIDEILKHPLHRILFFLKFMLLWQSTRIV